MVMVNAKMEFVIAIGYSPGTSVTLHVARRIAIFEVCVSQTSASVKVTSMAMLASTDDALMIARVMVTVTRVHAHVHKDGRE